MGLVFCLIVYYTPMFADDDGKFPLYYYGLVLFIYALHQVIFELFRLQPLNLDSEKVWRHSMIFQSEIFCWICLVQQNLDQTVGKTWVLLPTGISVLHVCGNHGILCSRIWPRSWWNIHDPPKHSHKSWGKLAVNASSLVSIFFKFNKDVICFNRKCHDINLTDNSLIWHQSKWPRLVCKVNK